MATPEEMVTELERLLAQVNTALRAILPSVTDTAFTDSDVRKAVQEAERVSRWTRTKLPRDESGYDYAIARAQIKAQVYGESFVVAEKGDDLTLLVVSKARLLKEKPFGLGENEIVYETTKATA